jgi:uncharacterized protein with ParB-like and HNH nuclease domain
LFCIPKINEEDNKIILIDGQQRTTTLYLLLWCLQKDLIKNIQLEYDIRENSKEFLKNLKSDDFDYKNHDIENSMDIIILEHNGTN